MHAQHVRRMDSRWGVRQKIRAENSTLYIANAGTPTGRLPIFDHLLLRTCSQSNMLLPPQPITGLAVSESPGQVTDRNQGHTGEAAQCPYPGAGFGSGHSVNRRTRIEFRTTHLIIPLASCVHQVWLLVANSKVPQTSIPPGTDVHSTRLGGHVAGQTHQSWVKTRILTESESQRDKNRTIPPNAIFGSQSLLPLPVPSPL